MRTIGRAAALLALSGAAIAMGGCGSGKPAAVLELALERGDLLAASHALEGARSAVGAEVTASRQAWPLVIDGVPASVSAQTRSAIELASERAGALRLPSVFAEQQARSLTGPTSGIAGTFRSFYLLATRGWRLIDAAVEQSEHGTPAAAQFARENVALYIESVYDAHFGLAQIGKQLAAAYKKLGGEKQFGESLTQAQVEGLEGFYSEADDQLSPHSRVRLGS